MKSEHHELLNAIFNDQKSSKLEDEYIAKLKSKYKSSSIDEVISKETLKHKKEWFSIIKKNFDIDLTTIEDANICWIPSLSFNASAKIVDEELIVAINQGFISCKKFWDQIEQFILRQENSSNSVLRMELLTHAFITLYRYFEEPFELPDLSEYLSTEETNAVEVNIGRTILFLIFHELAHLRMGHHKEELTAKKRRTIEYEADLVALSMANKSDSILLGALDFLMITAYHENWEKLETNGHPESVARAMMIKEFLKDEMSDHIKFVYDSIISGLLMDMKLTHGLPKFEYKDNAENESLNKIISIANSLSESHA